jgi:acetylornithine deacetylase/succinyl-diaminopimelate desuccinylase-like protein
VIEACEESGSGDLPAYIEALSDRIGTPSLVICLDSGCGNYDQLWITSSLRGLASGALTVSVLREGVHSGAASGIVPSSFRIARELLGRLEDARSGRILPPQLYVDVPAERAAQAAEAAAELGPSVYESFPFTPGARPVTDDIAELLLNRTWRPQLEIIGAAGLPTLDAARALTVLQDVLTSDPPYGAQVTFTPEQGATGWHAPPLASWLQESAARASREFFGRDARQHGEGGTIPFMAMLGERYPRAQFVITGVLGPHSNAHGPNEFLELATAARLTACVARVLADHYAR